MIIVKLSGGLGNQMFQYAFGKFLSQKNNSSLLLYTGYYGTRADRIFLLDQLNCEYSAKIPHRLILKLIEKIFRPKLVKDKYYLEPENLDQKGHLVLDGYWENPKYFLEIIDVIKNEFIIKNPAPSFKAELAKIEKNSISVHVRRGDYLVPHGKYLNGIEYYNAAVEKIIKEKNLNTPQIIIFSDDKEWCKQELKILGGVATKVFDNPHISDVEEMQLMSQFNHNVISNSTFSWWAALLNQNSDKIVVMPRSWYTDQKFNDIYLKEIEVSYFKII